MSVCNTDAKTRNSVNTKNKGLSSIQQQRFPSNCYSLQLMDSEGIHHLAELDQKQQQCFDTEAFQNEL